MSEFYCPVCSNHYRFPFDKWEAVLEAHNKDCDRITND